MGNCFTCQFSGDHALNAVCRQCNYICNLGKNLTMLGDAIELLSAARDDVLLRVRREERNSRRRLRVVQVWLNMVESIEIEFDQLRNVCLVELQRSCLCGFCPKNLRLTYRYGRRVFLLFLKVKKYHSSAPADVVSVPHIYVVVQRILQPAIFGRREMLRKAWNHLMDDRTKTMGLYGMGGVGKTTLLEQINNKFLGEDDGFDFVIWIGVSNDIQIEKIQDGIADRLGLSGGEWDRNTRSQKSAAIHTSMIGIRYVLLLDDIWSRVDLKEIGVPFPTTENKCKIVFTTRSREVCGRMGVHDPMEVNCLESSDALDLFLDKVGHNTLESHPEIAELARKVAMECRGLPLALNVIGETMACKRTIQEWQNAVEDLSAYAAKFPGMEDEILPILKYSYDNLREEHIKSCFLYCAFFPEDFQINKDKLIDYWICEGFMDKNNHGETAINQGYEIIGTLVSCCLLFEDVENKSYVSMHDVIRDMAIWIASDIGIHEGKCIVKAGVGLSEVPRDEDWKDVKRMSLIQNKIEQISSSPSCPQLTTLFLQENYKLLNISSEFFLSMPTLVVLDLSWNRTLHRLPEEISMLVSLRYLDLSRTEIEQLPTGLQDLKKLLHLNLEFMNKLERISGISKLWNLRTLKLRDSKLSLDISMVEELKCLDRLQVLTIDTKSSLVVERLLQAPRLVRCIKYIRMEKLEVQSFSILTLPTMGSLRDLILQSGGMEEIKISFRNQGPYFPHLSKVSIQQCDGLKDLTWLLFAPNLTCLEVGFSKELEDIISREKATSVTEVQTDVIVPFQKLEYIKLWDLPLLNNIFKSPLPFPKLRYISVRNSPKLKYLPVDSQSVFMINELVIYYSEREWLDALQWEDEATQRRFIRSFKLW